MIGFWNNSGGKREGTSLLYKIFVITRCDIKPKVEFCSLISILIHGILDVVVMNEKPILIRFECRLGRLRFFFGKKSELFTRASKRALIQLLFVLQSSSMTVDYH